MVAVPISDARFVLGEGLHWDVSRQCLWGVDIHGCVIWRWDLDAPKMVQWKTDQRVGWVLPLRNNISRMLLGLHSGVACADAEDMRTLYWLQKPFEGQACLRLNDAKADLTGAVWCGSLNNDDETRRDGSFFRLAPDGQWSTMDTGYTVANGPAINASQTVLMHTDSGRRSIYRFDLDVTSGTLHGKQVWKIFSDDEGCPDGMCFDAEDALWVAHWGAGCISRFGMDGRLLARVQLPVSQITSVCFGGPRMNRLFVSSAKVGLSAQQLRMQPLAGAVFEILDHDFFGLASLPASEELRYVNI